MKNYYENKFEFLVAEFGFEVAKEKLSKTSYIKVHNPSLVHLKINLICFGNQVLLNF
jgi:hypothetical protein